MSINQNLSITHPGSESINKNLSRTHPEPVSINKTLSRTHPGPVSINKNLSRTHSGPVSINQTCQQREKKKSENCLSPTEARHASPVTQLGFFFTFLTAQRNSGASGEVNY